MTKPVDDIEINLPEFLEHGFIPSPPVIMDQIRQATPDLDKIAALISHDMGLSASVLKTINSPFYGMRQTIHSIEQAVTLLGLDSVMSIVNAQLLLSVLKSGNYPKDLDSFWPVSTKIAETCMILARKFQPDLADEMYLLGLFHKAGIPIMAGRFPSYLSVLRRAYQQQSEPLVEYQNAQFQTNHTVVGYLTAKSWELSLAVRKVILKQHDIELLFHGIHENICDENAMLVMLKIAEHLCGDFKAIGKVDEDYEWELVEESVLSYLGLSELDMQSLADHVAASHAGTAV